MNKTIQTFLSVDAKELDQPELHGFLLAAVAPRPICLASTISKDGHINLSPFSFFNVFSSNPPILIFSPARRGRDNTIKHTLENVREVPEVVVNIVNYAMAEQMSLSSTEYSKDTNEFTKSGLTSLKSDLVRPPRVADSPISLECHVQKIEPLGEGPGAGNLVICAIVKLHIQKRFLDENGKLDTKKLELIGRMGGSWYTKAAGQSLFEIPKPLKTMGIGVDSLPDSIKNSTVLTGNNLGRLGNLEALPTKEQIRARAKDAKVINILNTHVNDPLQIVKQLHMYAQVLIGEFQEEKALEVLLFTDQKLQTL